ADHPERPAARDQSEENRERALRHAFPDDLAAHFGLALKPACQLLSFLFRGGADDQVAPAAHHVIALLLELVGELARPGVRLDPNLPRRGRLRPHHAPAFFSSSSSSRCFLFSFFGSVSFTRAMRSPRP